MLTPIFFNSGTYSESLLYVRKYYFLKAAETGGAGSGVGAS